ncbi:MAG: FadR family transcriptional regulator [Hyphomonadaceae bacterium]|jgi:DNA-binding FadR family transcriptional regulator|nr:FadR family transcriptional regulator [Hyphomonadaceae bacterium]
MSLRDADIDVSPTVRVRDGRRKGDSACETVGQRIVHGHLQPGELLPTEAELGREFGISRASLREGLRALSAKGLLETRTRRGSMVRPKACWDILDRDVLVWMANAPPDQEHLLGLLEVRAIIEPAAAKLAAQRASPRQILDIERAYSAMAASLPGNLKACCKFDLALHEGIIAAAGNVFLSRFAAIIRTALLTAFRLSADARQAYEASLAEHWAVTDAIRRRSPGEAERAMRALLKVAARDLAPAFKPARARPQSLPMAGQPRQSRRGGG